jgi:hypothetical protein
MSTLEQLKEIWEEKQSGMPGARAYNHESLEKIVRSRVNKHIKTAMQYFWASFTLQVLVYSLLSHVIVKYWGDDEILYFSIGGVFLFLPFTIMLMRKFKSLATTRLSEKENAEASVYDFVRQHQTQLCSFFKFKKWYELFLTPLSAAIGVTLIFKLYVPGGLDEHWTGAIITFIITVISCIIAIRSENRKSFKEPIRQLQSILDDFRNEG